MTTPDYRGLSARRAWPAHADAVERDGLSWLCELDFARIAQRLAPLPEAVVASSPRLRLLAAVVASPPDPDEIAAVATALDEDDDATWALCARCGQLYAIWSSGQRFERLAAVVERLSRLAGDPRVGDLARAFACGLLSIALVLGPGDMVRAEGLARRALALAEAAGSASLRVYAYTGIGYSLLFAGRLSALEALLFDADALAEAPGVTPVAGGQYAIMRALSELLGGRAEAAEARLARWLDEPGREMIGVHRLLASCHRMTAAAARGDAAMVAALAEPIQRRAVVEQRHFFQTYVHDAMAVLHLGEGRPTDALAHVELAEALAERCESRVATQLTPLLWARSLSELGRIDEARSVCARWLPRWANGGFGLFAAAAELELAQVALDEGAFDAGKRHLEAATARAELGDPPRSPLRPASFGRRLALGLQPPTPWAWTGQPVRVRALGSLAVERPGEPQCANGGRAIGTTLQVLAAVLSWCGEPAPIARVADLVWPLADGDAALHSLKVALSRLRRVGGAEPVPWILVRDHHISLDPALCAVDCLAARDLLALARTEPGDAELRRLALRISEGALFGDALETPWTRDLERALDEGRRWLLGRADG